MTPRASALRAALTLPWRGRVGRLSVSESGRGGVRSARSKLHPTPLAVARDPPPQSKSDISDFDRSKVPNSGKPELGGRVKRTSDRRVHLRFKFQTARA